MSIIIDIVLAASGILTIYFAYKRGFVSTVISLIGLLLALVLASYLGLAAADYIYEDVVGDKIAQNVIDDFRSDSSRDVNDILPKYISNYFKNSGEKTNDVLSGNFALSAIKKAIKTPVTALITVVIFLILFIVFLLLFRWIAKLAGLINKIPVIGKLNSLLGGMLGIVKALLIVYLLCFILSKSIMLTQNGIITADDLKSSYIFEFFRSKITSLNF